MGWGWGGGVIWADRGQPPGPSLLCYYVYVCGVCACVHVCVHACKCVRECARTVCMCVCVCVCMHVQLWQATYLLSLSFLLCNGVLISKGGFEAKRDNIE